MSAPDYHTVLDTPVGSPAGVVQLGVRRDTLARIIQRHRRVMVAQFYGGVREVHRAAHVFRGLNRGLKFQQNSNGDQDILIYSWKPRFEYLWIGGAFAGTAVEVPAPAGRVFVVLARKLPAPHGKVGAEIEHWNWIEEGPLAEAPINWEIRYTEKVWSRST